MAKVVSFLKKLPLKIILLIPLIVLGIIWLISIFFHRPTNTIVQKKINDVVEKMNDTQKNLNIDKAKIETETSIKLQKVDDKKEDFESKLETIQNLPRRKRAEELLKLHEKIKQERLNKK